MTVIETCSCGATIEISDKEARYVATALAEWRDTHRHISDIDIATFGEPDKVLRFDGERWVTV